MYRSSIHSKTKGKAFLKLKYRTQDLKIKGPASYFNRQRDSRLGSRKLESQPQSHAALTWSFPPSPPAPPSCPFCFLLLTLVFFYLNFVLTLFDFLLCTPVSLIFLSPFICPPPLQPHPFNRK